MYKNEYASSNNLYAMPSEASQKYRATANPYEERMRMEFHENAIRAMNHGPLYVDPDKIPEGLIYGYGVLTPDNKLDVTFYRDNLKAMIDAGWLYVPRSWHPEMGTVNEEAYRALGITVNSDIIERRGHVLMYRSAEEQARSDYMHLLYGRNMMQSTTKQYQDKMRQGQPVAPMDVYIERDQVDISPY